MITAVPGPRSRELGERLGRVESRAITRIDENGPIFWAEAVGSNVRDVDGNVYVDLTAGFGVAAAGHANPAVAAAVAGQAGRLLHAMGDVHPAEAKVLLLERLARLAPGDLGAGILSANGSDAVESALKTAILATGRSGVIAFEGGYHGLGLGALSVTHAPRFRAPFDGRLYPGVRFAPYPWGDTGPETSLRAVRDHVAGAAGSADAVGAVIVEPILGRGGCVVPHPGFLPGLRSLCDELDVVLIFDEIYTGLGRTGRWFACQHWDVVPDILLVGKALAGGLPLSVALGRPHVMAAWPASGGEAIHTSTFLGNPLACVAALANLDQVEQHGLPARAAGLGRRVEARIERWMEDGLAAGGRGLGLMRAVVPAGPNPGATAERASRELLARGVIALPEGDALAITPPLVITTAQLDHALDLVEQTLRSAPRADPASS
jgi:4-aminobutyrate aminotransferase / (S)-3-amino-2-methylpropionate transaminase / 5-aminovalerate transaminase